MRCELLEFGLQEKQSPPLICSSARSFATYCRDCYEIDFNRLVTFLKTYLLDDLLARPLIPITVTPRYIGPSSDIIPLIVEKSLKLHENCFACFLYWR